MQTEFKYLKEEKKQKGLCLSFDSEYFQHPSVLFRKFYIILIV